MPTKPSHRENTTSRAGASDICYPGVGQDHLTLLRGAQADGVVLEPGESFYLSSADCPTVILLCPQTGECVAFHAGRDCLFDRKHIVDSGEKREFGSVVEAALQHFPEVPNVEAFITCGISPDCFSHSWNDEKYGVANEKMTRHFMETCGKKSVSQKYPKIAGCLDLTGIVKAQLLKAGVREESIVSDGIDTYSEEIGDQCVWHSNRRVIVHQEKNGEEKMRNGVLVIRRL